VRVLDTEVLRMADAWGSWGPKGIGWVGVSGGKEVGRVWWGEQRGAVPNGCGGVS
jgi:hypothetical protein